MECAVFVTDLLLMAAVTPQKVSLDFFLYSSLYFHFPLDHRSVSGILENLVLLKPVLGVICILETTLLLYKDSR